MANRNIQRSALKSITMLAKENNWPISDTVKELHSRCDVTMLRAYRLAYGWTLNEVAGRIREQLATSGDPVSSLGHHRVSRWENGEERPSARYLDALCRLYRTRPDLLGFGTDYSAQDSVVVANSSTGQPSDRQEPVTPSGTSNQYWSRMERRNVIRGLLTACGVGLTSRALQALDQTRQHTEDMLQRRMAREFGVDWWEEQVLRHGSSYRVVPAAQLLSAAVLDFDNIQESMENHQSLDSQKRLIWTAARLAGLVGVLCIDLGEPGQANRWFQLGQIAAAEINDRSLRAWLRTREALVSLYYASPEDAARLARSARHLAGSVKCTAAAMAPAVEARALARLGREREAIAVLQHSLGVFETISATSRDEGVFGFAEQKLRFYEGNVLARTKASAAALRAQSQALNLYAPSDLVDRSHIQLDRSICLLRSGHLVEACESAGRVLLDLPPSMGIGAVLAEAEELRFAVPVRHSSHTAVKELDEIIMTRRTALVDTK